MIENFEGPTVKNGHFFGLPVSLDSAEILILQAPWDVTTSYRDGTSAGPRAILEASYQLDFFSPYRDQAWNSRIATVPAHSVWMDQNRFWRSEAKSVIASLEDGMGFHSVSESLARINAAGALTRLGVDQRSERATTLLVMAEALVKLGRMVPKLKGNAATSRATEAARAHQNAG